MIEFWLIASFLITLALTFVVPPLLRTSSVAQQEIQQNIINAAIYKEKLAELHQENLTPEQLTLAKQELERMLAQEVNDEMPATSQPRARWASLVVIIIIPVMAIAGYFKLGAPHFITPAQSSATENSTTDAATHLPANFSEMVDKLAARLEKQPTDAEGWYMLARSYTFLKQYDKAIPAYNKVLDIRGKTDPQLLTDLAETIALTKDGSFTGQAAELLQTALKLDPNYSQALWLSGFAAAQTENYQGAIDYWQRALAQISPDDVESKQMLEQEIATVRKLIPTTNEPNLTDAYATPTTAVQLEIHVKIDSQLQNRINPEDTLFIYAQATTGAPMPLAIVKKTAGELPITTTLNDNHAVMPTLKLSSVKEVTVLARISKSGLATAQPGDLQGKMTPIILGQQRQVNLLIDEIIP